MIKTLNREEHEEREREIQAPISLNILHQILISKAPEVRNWKRNMMESRDSRGEVSRQIKLECLQSSKNISLYSLIGHNRPIFLIDGYDKTVHRGPFQLSRDRWIWDGRSRWAF